MQQFTVGADESEVDAPRVDGYAVNLVNSFRPATDAFTHFVEEPEGVPVKAGWKLNRDVRKSMELLEIDPSFGDLSQYGAPALCAEIKRKIMPVHRQ